MTRFEFFPLVVLIWAFIGNPFSRWFIECLMIKKPSKKNRGPRGEFDDVIRPDRVVKKKKNCKK